MREEIAELLERGLTPAAIARHLGVAGTTVEYHLARLAEDRVHRAAVPAELAAPAAPRQVETRDRVAALLATGLSRAEIARRLGLSKATVSYHARRLGAPVDSRCARRYDWAAVQEYYDRGHSVRECMSRFGFSGQTWHSAVARGAVVARPARTPSDLFFVAGVHRSRSHVKARLVAEGFKEWRCEICGISAWRGEHLSLALHHVNGDRLDNRVENLQLLCPNCHSQTDSFSGRNGHRRAAPARSRPSGDNVAGDVVPIDRSGSLEAGDGVAA